MSRHNRRSFFKTLAAAAVATWSDVMVGPVAEPVAMPLMYGDLMAAYEAVSWGADGPPFFYCSRETLDELKVFSTWIDASSFSFKERPVDDV